MTRCHHGQLTATCPEDHGPYTWTWSTWPDPLRPIETDDEPTRACCERGPWGHLGPCDRTREGEAVAGCACLILAVLLAVAAGVVAGYLLGVTR